MTINRTILVGSALLLTLMMSACGRPEASDGNQAGVGSNAEADASQNSPNGPAASAVPSAEPNDPSAPAASEQPGAGNSAAPSSNEDTGAEEGGSGEILIIIDQTPKPTAEVRSFDFSIQKVPEGYTLQEMQWVSDKNNISNTPQEALQNGQTGADGFYISGDGQFSGFFYPEDMKGEKGQVIFQFQNDQGQELSWKKEIELK
ncbi:hypothetical protein AWM70_21635 [Paenibacillus yonginensis]|uniref:DUF4352 domain-containing protein n=1 Tax=Paenibacillus yonginensis TaxID=1462996 RepID=A0A1B1N625_9BACL|nr:hypothetical protein [Paenibacillus yonginensis]ANS76862.1 hypothetical protein AWM70_21635 [Paenibacillus yonginensis]